MGSCRLESSIVVHENWSRDLIPTTILDHYNITLDLAQYSRPAYQHRIHITYTTLTVTHQLAVDKMHVLGHSFSQKRKDSKRPRDLHIRKISFSGSTLSGCSLSSSDSTASAVTAIIPRSQHSGNVYQTAPPWLHERPFKQTLSPQQPTYDVAVEDSDADSFDDTEEEGDDDVDLNQFVMEMPPHASPAEDACSTDATPDAATDYFFFRQQAQRPAMQSRWSESTIQTVRTMEDLSTPAAEEEDDENRMSVMDTPIFSYKRAVSTPAAIQRPTMKKLNSVEALSRGAAGNDEALSSARRRSMPKRRCDLPHTRHYSPPRTFFFIMFHFTLSRHTTTVFPYLAIGFQARSTGIIMHGACMG